MEGIKILIIIFGILFIIERKPMNIIFNFIVLNSFVVLMVGIKPTKCVPSDYPTNRTSFKFGWSKPFYHCNLYNTPMGF